VRHHRLRPRIWSFGLLGPIWLLLAATLAATLPAQEASAHPIDEYVQNTYIDLAPDRTTLQIDLTPGVLVAPEVVALIDADGDGEISEAEGEAYAEDAVLRDVSLAVDGEPQPLTLVDSSFPAPLDMGAGMGKIRLHVAPETPAGSPPATTRSRTATTTSPSTTAGTWSTPLERPTGSRSRARTATNSSTPYASTTQPRPMPRQRPAMPTTRATPRARTPRRPRAAASRSASSGWSATCTRTRCRRGC
jgi:hypothetical protein